MAGSPCCKNVDDVTIYCYEPFMYCDESSNSCPDAYIFYQVCKLEWWVWLVFGVVVLFFIGLCVTCICCCARRKHHSQPIILNATGDQQRLLADADVSQTSGSAGYNTYNSYNAYGIGGSSSGYQGPAQTGTTRSTQSHESEHPFYKAPAPAYS